MNIASRTQGPLGVIVGRTIWHIIRRATGTRAPTAGRRRAPARRRIKRIETKTVPAATNSPIAIRNLYNNHTQRTAEDTGGAGRPKSEPPAPGPANSSPHRGPVGPPAPTGTGPLYTPRYTCTIANRNITRMCGANGNRQILCLSAAPVPLGLARSRRNARRSYALNINLISPRLPVAE